MKNVMTVHVEGLKELDAALGELSKSLAKGVLSRTLVKAGKIIAAVAEQNAPTATGGLKRSIIATTKKPSDIKSAGKAAYAAAMRSGASRAEAGAALRGATASGKGAYAEAFVGPDRRPAIIQEWGTFNQPAQPFMRPAWDAKQGEALNVIKTELGAEIQKTAKRAAARALKLKAVR
jgi:HK97 gp10 family phage protein